VLIAGTRANYDRKDRSDTVKNLSMTKIFLGLGTGKFEKA